ncbi:oligomeric, coiled-coil, peripheral membrane protein [Tulasnella sp. 419]|nr:oligomeric, coiled-coil, peripheral membrane protein [Tulasnella sp. 419]
MNFHLADTSRTNRQLIISAYARAAHFHHQHILHRHATLHSQSTALRIASSNLDSHVLSLRDAFESFETIANRELEKQNEILTGHALDMDIISRVKVHTEFLSANVRRAVEAGGKERHLGDYVSHHKMQMVAESCAKLHDDLLTRFRDSQARMADLISGADRVRVSVTNPFLDEADACVNRAKALSDRITAAGYDASLEEIAGLDADLREEVRLMADIKNQSMVHSVQVLRDVSQLQSDLSNLPPVLSSLDVDLRVKAGFPHLSRLHNMLYVYGATIVEIVRRKEFARLFTERAQTIAEMMAKMTANERKRRQVYRSEVHGQLPFEARGMDDPAPSLEINTSGSREPAFSISRDDLMQFLELVEEIERTTPIPPEMMSHENVVHPIREVLMSLDKLIVKIDGLEADFDKLAERSILSASWLANSNKRRSTLITKEASSSAYREALDLLQEKSDQERILREDREAIEAQLNQLRKDLSKAAQEKESMEEELQSLRDQVASETAARRSLEQRHSDALVDVVDQARQLESALAEATAKTKEAEQLKIQLQSVKGELEDVKQAHLESDRKVRTLLEEQAETLKKAEEARLRGEQDLKVQIEAARVEGEEAAKELLEKERSFRNKAVERDRLLRDQIAEADGDRAVLEHQFAELRNKLDEKTRELEEAKVQNTVTKADGEKLAEEVRKASKEAEVLKESKNAADMKVLREREVVQRLERQLESSKTVMQEIMAVALAIRETNLKVMASAQSFVMSSRSNTDSIYSPGPNGSGAHTFARSPLSTEFKDVYTSPSIFRSESTDPLDPELVLDILKQFDLEGFVDSINKTGSTIRKWQKQCKEYRERAKSKITFRNFAKGDLALFLPTRNSFAKPWAAFNGERLMSSLLRLIA